MARRRRIRTCLLLFLGVILALLWLGDGQGLTIEDGSTLVLEIGGEYVEASEPPWISRVLGEAAPPFTGLLSIFSLAERDPRLATVVIVIGISKPRSKTC